MFGKKKIKQMDKEIQELRDKIKRLEEQIELEISHSIALAQR